MGERIYKVILVGDACVGKSHLFSRHLRGTLPKTPQATIGIEFSSKSMTLKNGKSLKMHLWDTAGQEKYRALANNHYRNAMGALLVYDITAMNSFKNISTWLNSVREMAQPDIVMILVGNKQDLAEDNPSARQVPIEVASQFAQRNGLLFMETSAVSSYNVEECFSALAEAIWRTVGEKERELAAGGSSTGSGIVPGGVGGGSGASFAKLYTNELQQTGIVLVGAGDNETRKCC